MKHVKIGNLTISKAICGSNPFYGKSSFSEARNGEYLSAFTDHTITRTIQQCIEQGVNAIESCANERIISIVSKIQAHAIDKIHFIGTTRIDETSDMKTHNEKLDFLIQKRADICIIHSQYVEKWKKNGEIVGLKKMIDKIHEAGLIAGISTHRADIVELCEKKAYGIDVFMFPLNLTGFVYPGYDGKETVQDRINIVKGINKPFILIKTLGAGRIPPSEALPFILENSKVNDIISFGLASESELKETLGLVGTW